MQVNVTQTRRNRQAGYTLLMVVFMVATLLIIASAAVPSVLTQGKREMEQEMVWRGEQYARAIGLYYKKFGKWPTKVEDLTRQTNGVRFLRQAYNDPMNKEDGSWRFIYVGPNGQLIGSVKQTSLLQNSLGMSNLNGGSILGGGLQLLTPPGQGALSSMGGPGGTATAPTGPGGVGQQTNTAATPNPLESQPQLLTGNVIGGNIIGVGSKIDQPSFRLYLGGDTYKKWEFIWNPAGTANAAPGALGNAGAQGAPAGIPANTNLSGPLQTSPLQ